ncbi:MAG: CAP domain-containing protein [Planctomycetota bacterium]|nr:CAP domain-containing protein [Planctomycetota bacterium]
MRVAALLLLLGVLAGCGGGGGGLPDDPPPGDTMTPAEHTLAREVFALVNEARAQVQLPPVVWSEAAAGVAFEHAADMRVRDFYTHENPDGVSPCERLIAREIPMSACGGENIARSNPTSQDVMAAWMGSADHRANVLSPGVTHLGVGVHLASAGPWWVQDFYRYTGE